MKKYTVIATFFLLLILSFNGSAQQMTWRMTNPRISSGGGVDSLVWDVEAKCSAANTYLAGFTVVMGFDINAFVDATNSDIVVRKGSHYASLNPNGNPKYNLATASFTGTGSARRLNLGIVTNDNNGNPGEVRGSKKF